MMERIATKLHPFYSSKPLRRNKSFLVNFANFYKYLWRSLLKGMLKRNFLLAAKASEHKERVKHVVAGPQSTIEMLFSSGFKWNFLDPKSLKILRLRSQNYPESPRKDVPEVRLLEKDAFFAYVCLQLELRCVCTCRVDISIIRLDGKRWFEILWIWIHGIDLFELEIETSQNLLNF